MNSYYPENSFFGKAKFHPLFIIIFGLSLSITFITAIDIMVAKLSYPILGVSYEDYNHALTKENIPYQYLLFFIFRLSIIQILGFGLTGWLLALSANDWKKELFFDNNFFSKKVVWAGLIMIVSIPFYQVFMITPEQAAEFLSSEDLKLLKSIEEQSEKLLMQIMKTNLLFNILIFAVFPAICEEIFFRGFLFQNLNRFTNVFWSIFFSSLIFSLLHFQIYGFFVRLIMGAMLAFFFYFGKSIHTAIFAHFINNFFTTFVSWLALNGFISKEITHQNYQFHYLIVLSSFILTAIFTYLYYQSYQNEKLR